MQNFTLNNYILWTEIHIYILYIYIYIIYTRIFVHTLTISALQQDDGEELYGEWLLGSRLRCCKDVY